MWINIFSSYHAFFNTPQSIYPEIHALPSILLLNQQMGNNHIIEETGDNSKQSFCDTKNMGGFLMEVKLLESNDVGKETEERREQANTSPKEDLPHYIKNRQRKVNL